jgi:tRNA-Thr(GGU) m(6)t(6)A37 methyltransferase TsaA
MSSRDEIRRGERTVDAGAADDARVRFIGEIRTPWPDRDACPRQGSYDGPECRLVVAPIWHPALEGLEANEKIEVLYWLDRSRRDLVAQSPGNDGRTVGTFALRSPNRPNPIGTSLVRLVGIEDGVVTVRGLDCVDGTPLLDIKPHRCPHGGKAG